MNIVQTSLRFSVYITNSTFSFKQRYGWHGLDDPDLQDNMTNAAKKYPWIDNYRDKSVTEIEFLHGHLNSPGQIPAVLAFRDQVNCAVFFHQDILHFKMVDSIKLYFRISFILSTPK